MLTPLVRYRDSVTRFFASGFFLESVSPKPLIILLRLFQIFSKIRGDIHSSRFTRRRQHFQRRTPTRSERSQLLWNLKAKTVRRCFTGLGYDFCVHLYFVDANILSTPIFCWRQYFVGAYLLSTPIFCRPIFCRRQYFVGAYLLSTLIFCQRLYLLTLIFLSAPRFQSAPIFI